MDIAAFLTDRLDEDERVARIALMAPATDARWMTHATDRRGPGAQFDYPRTLRAGKGGRLIAGVYDEESEHIARHDPARVLADVAAKRAILAVHHRPLLLATAFTNACMGCGRNDVDEPRIIRLDDCPTLRALALTWADHPDYDATAWSVNAPVDAG